MNVQIKGESAVLQAFGPPSGVTVAEASFPKPEAYEVRIQIEASTVSATDTLIRKGLYPLLKDKPPFTLGYDFIGTVEAVGAAVANVCVGDRVADLCQIGGNATHICRPAATLLRVPKDVDAAVASTMILSGMTAYQTFKHHARVKAGDSFLVHGGSGAVGTTLLQLCKLNGIRAVTTASKTKHDAISPIAEVVIDYRALNYDQQLKHHAQGGFDVVLDFTNHKSFNRSFKLLKTGGRLIACGIQPPKTVEAKTLANAPRFTADFGWLMLKLTLWNALPNKKSTHFFGVVSSKRDFLERYQRDLDELFELIRLGQLAPLIHRTVSLSQVAEAHAALERGEAVGTIVVRPSGS